MSEFMEIIMLICFGFSWPINLMKNVKAKSTKHVSLAFYFLILIGYVAGIIAKFTNGNFMQNIGEKWYVLFFYFLNFVMVALNVIVYFINKNREKNSGENA